MISPPRVLIADRGDAGRRIDLMLRRHLSDVDRASRTRVQAWIENGQVTVNGTPVRRVAQRAALGDVVSVVLPPARPRRTMVGEEIALAVLYEDDYLLAIDKPAGVVVHPTHRHAAGTLMNALLWHARGWPANERPSLVGRLDKLTSGLVIVAKSAAVHAAMQRAMASSRTEKDYLAVVYGRVNVARGRIDLRLGRDPSDRRRIVAIAAGRAMGAPSLTYFERLARGAAVSLLRCRLATGRTHQIRVHLAARGWPLVGDPLYGKDGKYGKYGSYGTPETFGTSGEPRRPPIADPTLDAALRAFPRQALHAWRVAVTHPVTGERLILEAPIPRDFELLLTASGLSSLLRSASLA